jgi:rhodanese-related sulfurtransferase
LLVDVRTRAEWAFVGAADLGRAAGRQVFIEWQGFPSTGPNPGFADALEAAVAETGADTVFFICRSGGRSMAAAVAAAERFAAKGRAVRCVNVAEGFEGDLDVEGHRGTSGGWKARGLPWRQS